MEKMQRGEARGRVRSIKEKEHQKKRPRSGEAEKQKKGQEKSKKEQGNKRRKRTEGKEDEERGLPG